VIKPVSEAVALRRLYWRSFALRFSLAMLAWVLTQFARIPLLEDATYYSESAAGVAQSWLSGEQSAWLSEAISDGRKAWLMTATLAVFYCFTGGVEVLPVAIGCYCLLTSWTPVLAYRAGRRLGVPEAGAMIGARLVAYSPGFAFWSAALYKEGLILIVLFLLIDHALRLQEGVEPVSVLILAGCLLAMFGLRFYIAIILALSLVVGLVLGRRRAADPDSPPPIFRQALVLILLVSVFSYMGLREQAENVASGDLEENLAYMHSVRRGLADSRSGYLENTDISSVDKAIGFLPVGLAYFLLVPLPWHFGSLRQNLAIPETLFWIVVVYPKALRGLRRGAGSNPQGTVFLVLAMLAICCLYALFMGNIGTAYRVRIQVWAIIALFAGWGWHKMPVTSPITGRARAQSTAILQQPRRGLPAPRAPH